ncbi:MAG: twin-arginine translocation signal domain-containing protein, partial [Thermoguttaceae bacterium]|nr:twin-arginine translocation signal domain-containing protein [Thermoguttaceae bacterium]
MNLSRRSFLKQSTLLAASAAASTTVLPEFVKAEETAVPRPKIAVLGRLPDAAKIEEMQRLGIDGMEISGPFTMEEAKAAKKIADAAGFRFHSCMGGGSVERMELAAELGADAVLVVPGRVSGVKMPEPWEFKIQFDEKTNLLQQVVEGDNAPYADYIKAHNEAMQRARALVEGLIPAAEKLGITMGLENVWNNMWVHPAFAANF